MVHGTFGPGRVSFILGMEVFFRRRVIVADGLDDEGLRALCLSVRQVSELSLDDVVRIVREEVGDAGLAHTKLYKLQSKEFGSLEAHASS